MNLDEQFRLNVEKIYQRNLRNETFHYDPSVNFVFIPKDAFDEETFLLNTLHEVAHSTLSNTLIGFLLDMLLDIQIQATRAIHDLLLDVFYKTLPGMPEHRLKHILWQFEPTSLEQGDPEFLTENVLHLVTLWMAHRKQDSLQAALLNPEVQRRVNAFREIDRRRKLVIRHWVTCQEGYATWCQIWVGKSIKPNDCDMLIDEFFPNYSVLSKKHIREKVRAKTLQLETALIGSCENLPQKHIAAFQSFKKLEASFGVAPITTIARTLSHFPYQACNFLDMSNADFEHWINSPLLNSEQKLSRFLKHATKFSRLYEHIRTKGGKKKDYKRFIRTVYGNSWLRRLDDNSVQFHHWAINHLQNSKLCSNNFAHYVKIARVGAEFVELLDDLNEFNLDMRYSHVFASNETIIPPIITSDGNLYYSSKYGKEMLMSTFNGYMQVRNTLELLNFLERNLEVRFNA